MDTVVSSLARALLQVAAGSLIARGWITAGDADLLIGALVALLSVVWSILAKRRAAQIADARVEAAEVALPASVAPVLSNAAQVAEKASDAVRDARQLADRLRSMAGARGMSARRIVALGAASGLALSLVFFGLVFATGQTFGQRCAAQHERGSAGWTACVDRLAGGRP